MKKLFISLMLVFLVSSFSFAQINKGWDGTKPEVYKGSKNFVFFYSPFVSQNLGSSMAGAFTTPNINNEGLVDSSSLNVNQLYGIGFQYYVSSEIALALGFSFGNFSTEPTSVGPVSSYKTSGTTFGISLDGNYHFKPLYSVSPYLGLNINFGTGSSTIETSNAKREISGSSIGFGANFGFDWYFTPGLSLGGKYTFGAQMNSQPDVKYISGGTTNAYKGAKSTLLGTGIASIMLNVHF